MAQKKVILKDGSNELLPKTLASMVFTEAGQTVEEALQSAGGGGSSSGGGTGNVNVTNASSLQKDAYYAFQPSAAGSLTGKFATIPNANADNAGLMSFAAYTRLYSIDQEVELPKAIDLVTSSSSEINVMQLIGAIYNKRAMDDFEDVGDIPDEQLEILKAYGKEMMSQLAQGIADGTWGYAYTYNHSRISLVPTYTPPASGEGSQYQKASLELTYVSSGRLRTVTLAATLNSSGESATYDFTAKVEESGDDTYYLPANIAMLESGATQTEIYEAFGGEAKFKEAVVAVNSGKKLYIYDSLLYMIPLSACTLLSVTGFFSFMFNTSTESYIKFISRDQVKTFYLAGYELSPSLYSLTSSSSSDDISAAVGGEAGLKEIIQAVKDGNRLVIRGPYGDQMPITSSTEVISVGYNEGENGDMQLLLSYWVYIGIGMTHKILAINYTKSSNTFAVSASQDIS